MPTKTLPTSPTDLDRFDLGSRRTSQQLRITVAPGAPGSTTLYVLDPLFLLDLAVGARSLLTAGAGLTGGGFRAPTIVGVGYPTDDPAEVFALRARDLTPTASPGDLPFDLPPLAFGGAASFLEELVDEVIPAVEARHPATADTPRTLVGFSFSALFGVYSLLHRPDPFAGYLLGSPSLWWHDRLAFTWEQEYSRAHDDLAARVFLFVGANEHRRGAEVWMNERLPAVVLEQLQQVDNAKELAARLQRRNYPSLHVETAVLEGEFHLTAPAAGMARGMLAVIPTPQPDCQRASSSRQVRVT